MMNLAYDKITKIMDKMCQKIRHLKNQLEFHLKNKVKKLNDLKLNILGLVFFGKILIIINIIILFIKTIKMM